MKNLFAGIIIAGALAISGCHTSEVVVRERPVAPVYTRPHSPGPSYIWIEGGWVRSRGNYVYKQGYWSAPRHGRSYREGYWRNTRGGYVWVPGRW